MKNDDFDLFDWDKTCFEAFTSILESFGVKANKIKVMKYEALTPDTFVWFLSVQVNDSWPVRYVIYAEDYVASIDQILDSIHNNLTQWNNKDKYNLVEVKHKENWEESTPVVGTNTYLKPDKPEELMRFALPKGHYFVFLGKNVTKKETTE